VSEGAINEADEIDSWDIFADRRFNIGFESDRGGQGSRCNLARAAKLSNDERQKRLVAGARADGKLVYQVCHVFTLQMHIVDKQHTRGLFLGDFFAIEEKGPRCLNKFPPELVRARG
jgi:hypothetical protein